MRTLTLPVLAALAACSPSTGPVQRLPGTVERVVQAPGGLLIQRVTVSPAVLAVGDTLAIRSVLMNAGGSTVTVTATVCGVHLRGSLRLHDPFVRCAGWSQVAELAAGDSAADGRRIVAGGPPGRYVLEVRQLLAPDTWVPIDITVVP